MNRMNRKKIFFLFRNSHKEQRTKEEDRATRAPVLGHNWIWEENSFRVCAALSIFIQICGIFFVCGERKNARTLVLAGRIENWRGERPLFVWKLNFGIERGEYWRRTLDVATLLEVKASNGYGSWRGYGTSLAYKTNFGMEKTPSWVRSIFAFCSQWMHPPTSISIE